MARSHDLPLLLCCVLFILPELFASRAKNAHCCLRRPICRCGFFLHTFSQRRFSVLACVHANISAHSALRVHEKVVHFYICEKRDKWEYPTLTFKIHFILVPAAKEMTMGKIMFLAKEMKTKALGYFHLRSKTCTLPHRCL